MSHRIPALRIVAIAALWLGLALAAAAAKPAPVQAESSLTVLGNIDITADGKVTGYTLDAAESLPKGVVAMIARTVPQWRFEPVELPAGTISRTRMYLQFIARKREDGDYTVELASASFDTDGPAQERVTVARRGRMPDYPAELAAMGVNGTVYVVIKVDRDGKVSEADVSHVNLRTSGSEAQMAGWREQLSKSSLRALRGWRFQPPSAGPDAGQDSWTGLLPVAFTVEGFSRPEPGKWETYIPGPRKTILWRDAVGGAAASSDALPANQFHTDGSGRRLTTPLMGG